MRSRYLLIGLSLSALAAAQAQAQVATSIVADTQPGFDTGTAVASAGTDTTITGGEVSGGNLFHSFASFDLANGHTATWLRNAADANSILNIINRVRSGTPSQIDGTLIVGDMPNANFWFINPAGVIFGDGAAVQVPNAAYFSTAHEIGFGGGQRYSTVTPDGSTFSSAAPAAFGFLGGQGSIAMRGEFSTVNGAAQPSSVDFVAANIGVDANVDGNGTVFNFAAIGSDPQGLALSDLSLPVGEGTIRLRPGSSVVAGSWAMAADNIEIESATITASGIAGIVARANELAITNGARIETANTAGTGGDILLDSGLLLLDGATLATSTATTDAAGAIRIRASDATIRNNARITSLTDAGVSGNAGAITISAENLAISGGVLIESSIGAFATGNAGATSITAGTMSLFESRIASNANFGSSGNAGAISVDVAGTLTLERGGIVSLTLQETTGTGGQVTIGADTIDLLAAPAGAFGNNSIASGSFGAGNAGMLDVDARVINQRGGGFSTFVVGDGDAGDMTIHADEYRLTDGFVTAGTGFDFIPPANGNAGAIRIDVGTFEMSGGFVGSLSVSHGNAGLVEIAASDVTLTGGAISSGTFLDGAGGQIRLIADNATLSGDAILSSQTFGTGNAGGIQLQVANLLQVGDAAQITSSSDASSTGNAGNVTIDASELRMRGGSISSASEGTGDAGNLFIEATSTTLDGASITTSTAGSGNAGSIDLRLGAADLLNGASITSNSGAFSSGNAGRIQVSATDLSLRTGSSIDTGSGVGSSGNAGGISISANSLELANAQISSGTGHSSSGNAGSIALDIEDGLSLALGVISTRAGVSSTGSSGSISISADTIDLLPFAIVPPLLFTTITSESLGNGAAGQIAIDTRILNQQAGFISTRSVGAGDAGSISISAEEYRISGGNVSAFVGPLTGVPGTIPTSTGNAGQIRIDTDLFEMSGGAITSASLAQGDAGLVEINAGTARLADGIIASNTRVAGQGGTVRITADNAYLSGTMRVSSQTLGSGNAGSVVFDVAGELALLDSALVSSSTLGIGNTGNAGSVQITAGTLRVEDNAQVDSATREESLGNAGTVTIDVGTLEMSGGFIYSSTYGVGNAGNLTVAADDILLTEGATVNSRAVDFATGNAGNVTVVANDAITLESASEISASTNGPGSAGTVLVRSGEIAVAGGSINSTSNGAGNAGTVEVEADMLTMTSGFISSSVLTGSSGNGGNVTVNAADADLSGTAVISSEAFAGSSGNAGNVRVTIGGQLSILDEARISASTQATGSAGFVEVTAATLAMVDGSIESSTTDAGNAGNIIVRAGDASLAGDARINSSALRNSSGNAGDVRVDVSGRLTLTDQAAIAAATLSSGAAGLVRISAGTLAMNGGAIASSSDGEGDAGDVAIGAGAVVLRGNARVNSAALDDSTGNAGTVTITATDSLEVSEGARVAASTRGPGNAGQITLDTDLFVMDGGEVTSFTGGSGNAGLVLLRANNAILTNGATINSLTEEGSSGNAGGVGVAVTGSLSLTDNDGDYAAGLGEISDISASTFGTGNAGTVRVSAGEILIRGGNITSATSGPGSAGDVSVDAGQLSLLFASSIDSQAELGSSGNAGDVLVSVADILRIEPEGQISASSSGTGNAGQVEVHARVLDMAGGAINSFTGASGNAGLVGVFVDDLHMSGGRIDSASDSAEADAGQAGSVFIAARNASLSGAATIDSRGVVGDAGDVTIDVFGRLEIADTALVSASTSGSGRAGVVQLLADEIAMSGGTVSSQTSGSGNAGEVDVVARRLTMSAGEISSSSLGTGPDAGDAGAVSVRGNSVLLNGDALIASRGITGNAGDVTVEVIASPTTGELGDLTIDDRAQISASTAGSGDAGSVLVRADILSMARGEITSVTRGSGDAGSVTVEAGELLMQRGRITSASEDPSLFINAAASSHPIVIAPLGNAGDVLVRAGSAMLDDGSTIDSVSDSSNAGTVGVFVDDLLFLNEGSEISTAALGGGDAGDIDIAATTLVLDNFSNISSTAAGTFSAGTIEITADLIRILNGSSITTNSENGPAGDIALFLPSDGFLFLAGRDPGVITTSSGADTGGRIVISNPFLILSEGGSILALGQQGGANVGIQSSFFIRSSDTVNLVSVDGSLLIESNIGEQITGAEAISVEFIDASGILSGQCAGARQTGEVSQFSSRVTGPYGLAGETEAEADGDEGDDAAVPLAHKGELTLAPCL